MDWQQHLSRNTVTPQEAAKAIRSGDRVVFAHAAGSPESLVKALMERGPNLRNVEIVHMVALNDSPYCRPEFKENFRFNGLYLSGGTRAAVAEGRADYTPTFFAQIPALFREGTLPVDVALITISPPDAKGKVSLGVSVDYTRQAALSAKLTIAEINPNMPCIGGDALLDIREVDTFVHSSDPILELAPPKIGEVETSIGSHIAELIDDGACLQLGIGAIPDAVLHFLVGKKDLGIHSEMISDGVMKLVEEGVVTCARKTLHPGKIIVTFLMGSKKFYDWTSDNPLIEGYPVDYVNDPRIIGQNDNLISINSALSVDLLGQVAADSMGPRQFSGVGGQVDFVRGASFSKGGRSIIAMPSTASGGKVSRICGSFGRGQPVTTSRHDVDTVVTEHGVAELKGKTNIARARSLIKIAAPEYRDDLAREALEIYGWHVL
ncbi:MAG: 4-hydroxybutyrate--acetyl-CoA CoA transferase [Desulfovibrio sp.]|jgi:4-hydroxybutyrate CoA-transferase|nr:4-hydroxybutyrate--acetyl-CoA CoA transferase [Desulfovibrio sp.]